MIFFAKILLYIALSAGALAVITFVLGIVFNSYVIFLAAYIGEFAFFFALLAGMTFLAGVFFSTSLPPEIKSSFFSSKKFEYAKKGAALCAFFLVIYKYLPWPQILLSNLLLPGKLKEIQEINSKKVSIRSQKLEVAGIYKIRGAPLYYDFEERSLLFREENGDVSKIMPDGSKTLILKSYDVSVKIMPDGSKTLILKSNDENSLKTHLSKKAVPCEYIKTNKDLIATHPNFSLKPIYFDIQSLGDFPQTLPIPWVPPWVPYATKYGYIYLNLNYGNEDLILKFKNSLQENSYTVTVNISHLPGDDKKNELLLVCLDDRYGDVAGDFCFMLRVRDQSKT